MKAKNKPHYVDNKKFLQAMIEYRDKCKKAEEKNRKKFCIDKSIKKINIKEEADAINKPLAAEANVIANTTSDEDKGLWTTSVIVPIIFPIINEELE